MNDLGLVGLVERVLRFFALDGFGVQETIVVDVAKMTALMVLAFMEGLDGLEIFDHACESRGVGLFVLVGRCTGVLGRIGGVVGDDEVLALKRQLVGY
jgi:hypothetical protein